jgi:hypothetical protein
MLDSNGEVAMARTEMSDEELEIHKNAISSSIRKDFLKADVSYQDANEIQHLVGYKRNTDEAKRLVRHTLKEDFDAAIVPVGDSKVAIVKRPKEG